MNPEFVTEAFSSGRSRFGPKRKDGVRQLKGNATPANRALWSLRDLRKGIASSEAPHFLGRINVSTFLAENAPQSKIFSLDCSHRG